VAIPKSGTVVITQRNHRYHSDSHRRWKEAGQRNAEEEEEEEEELGRGSVVDSDMILNNLSCEGNRSRGP
jgi:hypothetical protein